MSKPFFICSEKKQINRVHLTTNKLNPKKGRKKAIRKQVSGAPRPGRHKNNNGLSITNGNQTSNQRVTKKRTEL